MPKWNLALYHCFGTDLGPFHQHGLQVVLGVDDPHGSYACRRLFFTYRTCGSWVELQFNAF